MVCATPYHVAIIVTEIKRVAGTLLNTDAQTPATPPRKFHKISNFVANHYSAGVISSLNPRNCVEPCKIISGCRDRRSESSPCSPIRRRLWDGEEFLSSLIRCVAIATQLSETKRGASERCIDDTILSLNSGI